MSGAIDWDQLMRLGFGVLRLEPAVFWAMTPVELDRALEGTGLAPIGGQAPGRPALEALMARYPDKGETNADG